MPVGACGICCDVCEFYVKGVCVTCCAGIDEEGVRKKQDYSMQYSNMPCPILACAFEKKIAYCIRDCGDFPCENFRTGWESRTGPGPCPYSDSYLAMFSRRRAEGNYVVKFSCLTPFCSVSS